MLVPPLVMAWKVVEIGAEGTVDDQEGWQQGQAKLYGELTNQLKDLWAGEGRVMVVEPSPTPAAQ